MAAPYHVGAAAPGPVTPAESDKAPWQGRFIEVQERTDSLDCADITGNCNVISTATARAALLGIEVRQLADGAWLLRHARGASIGTVQGADALAAAVAGFEAASNDVRTLVHKLAQSLRGAAV